MRWIKRILAGLMLFIGSFIYLLFRREKRQRERVESELKDVQLESSAMKETRRALEIKQAIQNRNLRDSTHRIERMRRKGYLRD